MLKNPQLKHDPFLDFIDGAMSNGRSDTPLQEGIVLAAAFSFGNKIKNIKDEYPELENDIGAYGVCDSLEQLLEKMPNVINDPDKKYCISLTEIRKDEQPCKDGWRWHKWGGYIGTKNPQHEYLHDEDDSIQSVFCYHIYELLD